MEPPVTPHSYPHHNIRPEAGPTHTLPSPSPLSLPPSFLSSIPGVNASAKGAWGRGMGWGSVLTGIRSFGSNFPDLAFTFRILCWPYPFLVTHGQHTTGANKNTINYVFLRLFSDNMLPSVSPSSDHTVGLQLTLGFCIRMNSPNSSTRSSTWR